VFSKPCPGVTDAAQGTRQTSSQGAARCRKAQIKTLVDIDWEGERRTPGTRGGEGGRGTQCSTKRNSAGGTAEIGSLGSLDTGSQTFCWG